MVGRTGIWRESKETNFTQSYTGQEIVESHGHPYPKEI